MWSGPPEQRQELGQHHGRRPPHVGALHDERRHTKHPSGAFEGSPGEPRRIHELAYEDLLADRARAMAGVAAHLGVDLGPLRPKIVRQRTHPLSAAIANYDELQAFFAGSAWEDFFRAPDSALAPQEAA